jgi:hypothetical protein
VKSYPFLREIPPDILQSIDLACLHIPANSELILLKTLSVALQKNIVIYKTFRECNGKHLCRKLIPATLTASELSMLTEAERKLDSRDKAIVAYERPLILRPESLPGA